MVPGRHRHREGRGSSRWRWPLLGFGAGGGAIAAVVLALGIGQVTQSQACAAMLSAAAAGGTGAQTATHYVLQGLPNCSYPSPAADGLFVALPPAEYGSAAACGGYLQVSGPDGSVRVKVIDQCPDCATGHIDLSEAAFAKLAPLSAGLINVSYTSVSDPPLPGPVSLEVKQGSSQYWLALLADNTGNPLASVQVETSSGWLSLARASYNYWIAQSGAGPGPFTVRLTDTQGHQATVSGITLSPGAVQPTGTWLYGGGSDPAPAAAVPASSQGTASSAAPPPRRPAAPTGRVPSGPASPAPDTTATRGPAAVRQRPVAAMSPVPSARSSC
jgi:expansin (peptidoglycan-binding protein)